MDKSRCSWEMEFVWINLVSEKGIDEEQSEKETGLKR
jgi:hypothetical protein